MRDERYYAVVMTDPDFEGQIGYEWTSPHPDDPAPSTRVMAIYPSRKAAEADKRFRGGCRIQEVLIVNRG